MAIALKNDATPTTHNANEIRRVKLLSPVQCLWSPEFFAECKGHLNSTQLGIHLWGEKQNNAST